MNLEFSLTKEISKIVTTDQVGLHEDLEIIFDRNSLDYQRPMAPFSIETYAKIKELTKGKKIIFDFGCGVGESTYKLAIIYPNCVVIGIDKSISRIERQNDFKQSLPSNAHLLRGELLDLIYLIYLDHKEGRIDIERLYFLYPNPWPKKMHVKRRFHANPIAPFIYGINVPIIVRSNWKLYLEEFSYVAFQFKRLPKVIKELVFSTSKDTLTPFERKYFLSNQALYELEVL